LKPLIKLLLLAFTVVMSTCIAKAKDVEGQIPWDLTTLYASAEARTTKMMSFFLQVCLSRTILRISH
jgi:hypothetical protein